MFACARSTPRPLVEACLDTGTMEDVAKLRSFVIPGAKQTDKQLGQGCYGSVYEVEVDGLTCVGKKFIINQDPQTFVDKLYSECSLLSSLHHPNIIQFLGICCHPKSGLPLLVMECLQSSLDKLLQRPLRIPIPTRVSIIQDVARGLVYLHSQSPPVVHGDLSARNILLNLELTAKITDLSNTRLADITPNQVAQSMTEEVLVHLPPEALTEVSTYGTSFDMFSFGSVALFTAVHMYPQRLPKPTHQDHKAQNSKMRTHSEVENHEKYTSILHEIFGQKHLLVTLINGCLQCEPAKRPTARQALEKFREMSISVSDIHSNLDRLQLVALLKEKEEEVQRLYLLTSELNLLKMKNAELVSLCKSREDVLSLCQQEVAKLKTTILERREEFDSLSDECADLKGLLEQKNREVKRKQEDLNVLKMENGRLADETTAKDRKIALQDEQILAKGKLLCAQELALAKKDCMLTSLQQSCTSLQENLHRVQSRNQSLEVAQSACVNLVALKDDYIDALQTELMGKNKLLHAKTKVFELPSMLTFCLPMYWKGETRMPSGVSHAQAVVISGKLYIGGGWNQCGDYKLLEYTICNKEWREFETPLRFFGMAESNNQLIICGGEDGKGQVTNQMWVLDGSSETWTMSLHAMPTPRRFPSMVRYKTWLLVIGGRGSNCVEIFDTESKQWHIATPLPLSAFRPSITVIKDIHLYAVWNDTAVTIPIPSLVADAKSHTSNKLKFTEWQQLPSTPSSWPAITAFHDILLAVGGGGECPSATIAAYLPQIEQWTKVGDLPVSRSFCTCAILSETKELMVIGGRDANYFYMSRIDTCTV